MASKVQGISKITVKGFKSLYDETSIDIRPLTILAGANSSGKSSIMQPLLLMKQTLESTYTPKVFLLNGPNVRYTDPRQFFHIDAPDSELEILIEVNDLGSLNSSYALKGRDSIQIDKTIYQSSLSLNNLKLKSIHLAQDMSHEDLYEQLPIEFHSLKESLENMTGLGKIHYKVGQHSCFLNLEMAYESGMLAIEGDPIFSVFPLATFSYVIQDIIHVSGLRDNPERSYPIAQIEGNFKGTFDKYFASVISDWGQTNEEHKQFILKLVDNLTDLTLASGLSTSTLNNQISIEIPHLYSGDSINIADVGLGVSQALPVLVALLVAKEGQLVYLEQPELHLHPRAQVALAKILADAAKRGVRVVVETHSSLLLIGIQTLIAEGKLKPEDTILHWFTRGDDGKTTVDSQVPDENGVFGETPEDFGDVELSAQNAYITAVEERMFGQVE
ncbi:MAG: AAA family ATPase [Phototrophicaceae bacterium]